MTDAAPILELKDLSVRFDTPDGVVEAVRSVSLEIKRGECLGVVGESGSGKSQSFLAAVGLLQGNGRAEGEVLFEGRNLLALGREALNAVRGAKIGFVFQDPLTALTPHLRVGDQMREVLALHKNVHGREADIRCVEWLARVRVPEAARRLRQYPHELSGGMRQRVMLAMAMLADPALLIADEPTTALDATVQAQVLDLIDDLRADTGAAVALITHDMGVIARLAQRVAVMREGRVVETGPVDDVFAAPKEDYTRRLLEAVPRIDRPVRAELAAPPPGPVLLEAEDVAVSFPMRVEGGLFGKIARLPAVDGVSFTLREGETLGVVGESGSGKSTLARAVLQLLPRQGGAVSFLGRALDQREKENIRAARKDMQIVFQDPMASLDPRMPVGRSVEEPLLSFAPELSRAEREARVGEALRQVGLDPSFANRYPHELSGGQNQRIGIARAVILKPKLIVCDEAVSALDVSIQAQVIELLAQLRRELHLSMIFISHDLAVVREISHNVLVLYLGRPMEYGPAEAIMAAPRHPYTRALLAAAPIPDPALARARERLRLTGEPPSPLDTRSALRFLTSKMKDDPAAAQVRPAWIEAAPGHFVAEHDPA